MTRGRSAARLSRIGLPLSSVFESGEFVEVLLDKIGELRQKPPAVAGVHARPGSALQRSARRLHGQVDVFRGTFGDIGDLRFGGGVEGAKRFAGDRFPPFSVNEQAGLADLGRGVLGLGDHRRHERLPKSAGEERNNFPKRDDTRAERDASTAPPALRRTWVEGFLSCAKEARRDGVCVARV